MGLFSWIAAIAVIRYRLMRRGLVGRDRNYAIPFKFYLVIPLDNMSEADHKPIISLAH